MERSWWWKTVGILFLTVLAVVYLLPTLLGEHRLPAWYTKYVKAKLQLGLDLQGGIHLVYEVEMDKAVSDKCDRLAADIEQQLRKDAKVAGVKLTREGRDDIVVQFAKPADLKLLDKKLMAGYRNQLTEADRNEAKGTLRLRMDEAYMKEVEDYALRQGIETIRGRVDKFGVAEPTIIAKGRDIVVELPGLTKNDFDRVKKVIGRTAQLEFKICDDANPFMKQVAAKVPEKGPITVRHESFDGKQHGTVSYTYLQSRDKAALEQFIDNLPKLGVPVPKTHEILLGEEQAKDEKGDDLPDKTWITYLMFRRAELTGDYIADAEVEWDQRTGRPEVGLTFDHTGASVFERVSGDHVGDRMAIILDSKVNSAPVLQSRIGGGRARITLGGFKDPMRLQQEAKDLVAVLRAGALPAPLRKTFETQVGPTLGGDAIQRGKWAFGIATILVVLFMIYYYRASGIIADTALIFNVLFIMAIMSAFQAALSLPGIAGIVLTLGMAVDANVLINERIREELRAGKTPRAAIETGYNRAFWTIFDSQLTTAIAGFVLLQYGTGPLRGFAVTLLIGILCSVFTGVWVTRLFFDLWVAKLKPKTLSI
jgi:preprotein translocase subunit SecD